MQLERQWYQQDGATAHTAGTTRDWLRRPFEERLISSGEAHAWPAHSPDLTPMDFFLWGHLKLQVYRSNFKTSRRRSRARYVKYGPKYAGLLWSRRSAAPLCACSAEVPTWST